MLYDTSDGPPPPGSLRESVFLLMAKKRREADFFRTKLLVEAFLAPHTEGQENLQKAFEAYREAMFPYLEGEAKRESVQAKEMLDKWVGQKALRVKPLWRASEAQRGIKSRLRKGRERVKELEEERRHLRLVRI